MTELQECSFGGCDRPGGRSVTTGSPLCEKHYQQWRRGRVTPNTSPSPERCPPVVPVEVEEDEQRLNWRTV